MQEIREGSLVKLVSVYGEPVVGVPPVGRVLEIVRDSGELRVEHTEDGDGFDFWPPEEVEVVPTCTTCGERATHYVAFLNTKTLQCSSINGLGYGSPSCKTCDGVDGPDVDLVAIRSKVI